MDISIKLESVVQVFGLEGKVKFIGKTQFSPGEWVGVELDTKDGRNNGSVQGVKYFECQEGHGVFVRPSQVVNQETKNFHEKQVRNQFKVSQKLSGHSQFVEKLIHERNFLLEKIERLKKYLNKQSTNTNQEENEEENEEEKKEVKEEEKKEKEEELPNLEDLPLDTESLPPPDLDELPTISDLPDLPPNLDEEKDESGSGSENESENESEEDESDDELNQSISDLKKKIQEQLIQHNNLLEEQQTLENNIEQKKKVVGFRNLEHYQQILELIRAKTEESKIKYEKETQVVNQIEIEKEKLIQETKKERSRVEKIASKLKKILNRRAEDVIKIEKQRQKILRHLARTDTIPYESVKEFQEKIKNLKADLKRTRKKILDIQTGKSEKEIIIDSILKPDDEIDKSEWKLKTLLRYPEITELKTRINPMNRMIQFSKLYGSTKNYINYSLSKEAIVKSIIQYFSFERKEDMVEYLENNTSISTDVLELDDNRLLTLIKSSLRDTQRIFDLTIYESPKPNTTKEEQLFLVEELVTDLGLSLKIKNDVNIWLEKEDSEDNIRFDKESLAESGMTKKKILHTLACANLNKLIERLSWDQATDHDYVRCFLMTFSGFLKPEHLLEKLIQRYHVPLRWGNFDEKKRNSKKNLIQLRVGTVLSSWIKTTKVFDPRLLSDLEAFVTNEIVRDHEKIGVQLLETIKKFKLGIDQDTIENFKTSPPEPKRPKHLFSPKFRLEYVDELEFARQLTIYVSTLFRKIQPEELVTQAWSKTKLRHKAKNVLYLIKKFNDLVGYIETQIVIPDTVRGRAKKLSKFIRIGEHLLELNNFDSVMATVAAISSSSITRLKWTATEVSKSLWNKFDELEEITSSDNGFGIYRETLENAQLPALPYLGMFLTDLTFISDGTPDKIDGLINFSKRKLLFRTIEKITNFQLEGYNLIPIYQIQKLFDTSLNIKGDIDMYQISLLREPRKAPKSSIKWK
ncbi:ras guanine nucleotide exchange factor a [Anaeramoeba flamelloides]|uniref:Ras guanine nucleotide exchange factor a n=1 Tax=Anaeramoeba flamelloides TaxID=1746091 RepID=A0ABQ8YHJ2_9EUKA|nr:ras guanine nucleotide exchange factor a [Anaeramoeba flamelloides]